MTECPDIDFSYDDSDSYENEIAELYSYSEGPEFQLNLKVSHLTVTATINMYLLLLVIALLASDNLLCIILFKIHL